MAINAPFDNKDKLKEQGYRWDGERKIWNRYVTQLELDDKVKWLTEDVYNNKSFKLELEKIDALNRFSHRRGQTELLDY